MYVEIIRLLERGAIDFPFSIKFSFLFILICIEHSFLYLTLFLFLYLAVLFPVVPLFSFAIHCNSSNTKTTQTTDKLSSIHHAIKQGQKTYKNTIITTVIGQGSEFVCFLSLYNMHYAMIMIIKKNSDHWRSHRHDAITPVLNRKRIHQAKAKNNDRIKCETNNKYVYIHTIPQIL